MAQSKFSFTFITALASSILSIINGLLIAIIDKPIYIATFPANSSDEIIGSKYFWGRVVFGMPSIAGGLWTYFWMIFAILILFCALTIYRKPRSHKTYGFLITLLSLLTLPIGGGFYIGAALGFIGGIAAYEWPKPFNETFLGNIFSAARIRSKFYASIGEKPEALSVAALTLIFIGALSGIGNGLYAYNVHAIKAGGDMASKILLEGYVFWNEIALFSMFSIIGMTVIKWLILSLCVYWIGAKLVNLSTSYDKVLRTVAYIYAPEAIMVFLPLIFSNEPTLTFYWPVGLYLITRIWIFICLLTAIRQIFDFSLRRALGVAIFGGVVYWVIYHVILVPTLNVPGFRLDISIPQSSIAILTLIGLAILISTILGVFSKKQIS
jgi:hypothetical protein